MRAPLSIAAVALAAMSLETGPSIAGAHTETVLYSFTGSPDGAGPGDGSPVMDQSGNLYGVTFYGGAYNNLGTVWKLTPSGTESAFWSFGNGADGASPAGVIMDPNGNLFGTTAAGGAYNLGTVFEITPSGTETVLWSFGNGVDGAEPARAPIMDQNGNLYGTTWEGGAHGYGTVYEFTSTGTEKVLWNFLGNETDQGHPEGLMLASNGYLYGMSAGQSTKEPEWYGQVWEVTGQGKETDLYSFKPPGEGVDGEYPAANVIIGQNGNLFGTCHFNGQYGYGTVFELTLSGTETIFHAFNGKKGGQPYSDLTMDKKGNLYSTTYNGSGDHAGGTVWKMSPSGKQTVLHYFAQNGTDGYNPLTGVLLDGHGVLYGTTLYGGHTSCTLNGEQGCGTVYKISP